MARLPPPGDFDLDLETLVRLNAEHDSRIVGPSLEDEEARAFLRNGGEGADDGSGHVVLVSPRGGTLSLTGGASPGVDHLAFACRDREHLAGWQGLLAGRSVTPGSITDAPYGSGFVVRDPDGLEPALFADPGLTP